MKRRTLQLSIFVYLEYQSKYARLGWLGERERAYMRR